VSKHARIGDRIAVALAAELSPKTSWMMDFGFTTVSNFPKELSQKTEGFMFNALHLETGFRHEIVGKDWGKIYLSASVAGQRLAEYLPIRLFQPYPIINPDIVDLEYQIIKSWNVGLQAGGLAELNTRNPRICWQVQLLYAYFNNRVSIGNLSVGPRIKF
jgi:hypothetical protein